MKRSAVHSGISVPESLINPISYVMERTPNKMFTSMNTKVSQANIIRENLLWLGWIKQVKGGATSEGRH